MKGQCSLRTQGAEGDLSDRYGAEDCFDGGLLAMAAIATGDSSTVLKADLVRSRELTLEVVRVLSSPKS